MIDPEVEREDQAHAGARWLSVECTSISCPLQIEGSILGDRFYYRARHGRWRLYYHLRATAEELYVPVGEGTCSLREESSIAFALRKLADLVDDMESPE